MPSLIRSSPGILNIKYCKASWCTNVSHACKFQNGTDSTAILYNRSDNHPDYRSPLDSQGGRSDVYQARGSSLSIILVNSSTYLVLFQRKTPVRQAAIIRIFPRSVRHLGNPFAARCDCGEVTSLYHPPTVFFNTPIMVNPSVDHEKQPARPYKCPYPLCGRAFSRLEHQVLLSSFSPTSASLSSLDETHTNTYRRKTIHLYLSLLRKTLFSLGRTHSSLSYTQQ